MTGGTATADRPLPSTRRLKTKRLAISRQRGDLMTALAKSRLFLSGLGLSLLTVGCAHNHLIGKKSQPCTTAVAQTDCCEATPCGQCGSCTGKAGCGGCLHGRLLGFFCRPSNAVPQTLPLGSTIRAHDQVMQTNAEATDFVMHRLDFVGQTAELTSDGKDQVLEIAARMRSAPFPVIIEREPNNSDPELDALRRNLVAQILTDLGNQDAQQRTIVGLPYGPGYWAWPGQMMYYQFIGGGYNNGYGNGFGGGGGGFGGGGFGGGGGGVGFF